MKNKKGIVLIFGMFLLLGSMSSCKAIKRAKAKRCKCPSWSMQDQQQKENARKEDAEIAFDASF